VNAIFCIYGDAKGDDIGQILGYWSHFSDVISSQAKCSAKGIAFVSLDGENINYVMAYHKSGRVATQTDRLTFNRPIYLKPLLSLTSIKNSLPNKFKKYFQNQTSVGISVLSANVYQLLIGYIQYNHPRIAIKIKELLKELNGPKTTYRHNSAVIAAHEKDAICLALRVSGFEDDDVPKWSQESESAPFLQGYKSVVIREDSMVIHDSQVFGDWKKIKQFVVGAAEFRKEGHKLTIINVNRHKIEETLGVDLIMYHHTYKSYVLIQYKRMTKEGDSLCYRPANQSYHSEISRMKEFQKSLLQSKEHMPHNYRLNDEFFYFKLCPAEITTPMSTEMIKGMYLPISYWELLLSSAETLGDKGGRLLNYSNIKRYINNTLFIELAQNGWIGSRVANTELITAQIQESIQGDKSLILANYTPNESNIF